MRHAWTTRQLGELLIQPEWRIRRVVDTIDGVERFGGKRVIPRDLLPAVIDALRARGWLSIEPEEAGTR